MTLFSFSSSDAAQNQGLVIKSGAEMLPVFVDFADGLINSAVTITTVNAIALDSNGAVVTSNVVGTTAVSGSVARVDLRTCGTNGTADAVNNDRFRMTVTATCSSGGPLTFTTFLLISAPGYDL